MKIIELKSSNIKRLKAVELKLDDKKNLVMITGKNAQGKSSILDSIWFALGGKKAAPGKPIRDGEEKAEIELNLDGYIVKRSFTEKGSYLVVNNKEGAPYSNPQEFLDFIISNLSFDPLEFTRLDSKKQVDTIAKIVGMDLGEFDIKKKNLTNDRLLIGREIKAISKYTEEQVKQALDDLKNNKDLPSSSELIDQLNKATAEVQKYESAQSEILSIETQIKQLQDKLAVLKEIKNPGHDLVKMKSDLESLESRADKKRNAERVIEESQKVDKKQAEYDALTDQINNIEQEKASKLSSVKMPIEGLSWDENSVLYKGIPYDQISSAEQLKISMAIAMATNPKLQVILIRDGSLLDKDNLAIIEEMAIEKDFQVWVESVDDTGKVGIYIEDGQIKKINK